MGVFDSIGSALGVKAGFGAGSKSGSSTTSTKKVLSQEAIDKLIYDALSADNGLAALVNMENASGGHSASTKGLMAQDFLTKVIGEIANITAETVETTKQKQSSKEGKVSTVICTHLATHGYMPMMLYLRGVYAYTRLNPITVRGYHFWAVPVVRLLQKYNWLCKFLAPIAIKRYEYVVDGKFSITGFVSVYIAQPICYLIGLCVPERSELAYGN